MRILSAMQPHYLPWLGYFELINLSDVFVFLDDLQLPQGRSFVNRTKIRIGDDSGWLTVPILRDSRHDGIQNVLVSNENWITDHTNILQQNYRTYPFLDTSLDFLHSLDSTKTKDISQIDIHYIQKFLSVISSKTHLNRSSSLQLSVSSSERLIRLCKTFDCDTYLTGHGALNYLDFSAFEASGIEVKVIKYRWDLRGLDPLENGVYLSVLDFISRLGNEWGDRSHSTAVEWRDFSAEEIGYWRH